MSKSFRICFWLICSGLLLNMAVFAQQIVPQNSLKPSNARTQALSLPFFDDFSLARNTTPDPALWKNGGTYISNTFSTNHPSVNVAVFDGANALGTPYDRDDLNAQGYTDTLTSLSINLKGLSRPDSVVLSFYWQAKSLGELPDANDSLIVQFLASDNKWQTIWIQRGGKATAFFNYTYLVLSNSVFFHENFQFRFLSAGRKSGQFDNWAIDYVYLNKGRSRKDRFLRDFTVYNPISSFLKRYRAMPLSQYLANAQNETSDSIHIFARKFSLGGNPIGYNLVLIDEANKKTFGDYKDNFFPLRDTLPQKTSVKIAPLTIDFSKTKRTVVVSKFKLFSNDNADPSIPGIDLRRNDSMEVRTDLDNYYAYDDGSAEYAVYMNRSFARTAVRYVLNKLDSISAVRVNLVPILKNLTGQSITIQMWGNKNGKPNGLLYQKSYKVSYPPTRDEFTEFAFDVGIAVRDTFYVGWQQNSAEGVAIGLDKNTFNQDQIFVNLGTEWATYSSFQNDPSLAFFKGSLMIRPVVGGKATAPLTAAEKPIEKEWIVYPNPTSGIVRWQGEDIKNINVYTLSGKMVRSISIQTYQDSINIADLAEGIYLFQLSDEQKNIVKKVMLRK